MKNKLIIGIGHQRNVGKDTVKRFILDYMSSYNFGVEYVDAAFADPLYEICEKLYGWAGFRDKAFYDTPEGRVLKEQPLPEIGKSPRQILIEMGTPAIRKVVYEDTWIKYAMNRPGDILIFSDMRFPNEAQAIRDEGGILIKVTRPGVGLDLPSDDPDVQLNDWNDWDYVIENDGDIKELQSNSEYFCKMNLIPRLDSGRWN